MVPFFLYRLLFEGMVTGVFGAVPVTPVRNPNTFWSHPTKPQNDTRTNNATIPQIIIFFPSSCDRSSPACEMNLTIPQKNASTARETRSGMIIMMIFVNMLTMVKIPLCAKAIEGETLAVTPIKMVEKYFELYIVHWRCIGTDRTDNETHDRKYRYHDEHANDAPHHRLPTFLS